MKRRDDMPLGQGAFRLLVGKLTNLSRRVAKLERKDTAASAGGGGAHASDHITGGSDEVDGDQLDIDWNPSNSTPATTPSQVTSVDHLTAHLYGIDQAIAGKAASSHTHVEADITDLQSYIVSGSAAGGDLGGTYPNPTVTDDSHAHTLSTITDSGTAAAKNIPASGDASATEVVYGTDTRLTDARTPASHTHTLSDVTDSGTAAAKNIPAAGDASATEVVYGTDTRLTDARTPASHTHVEADITDLQAYALDSALTAHISDTIDAHDASAVSNVPAGNIAATTVQAAIDELDSEKAATSHTHVEADITDLGSYSVTGHSHTLSDVTDSGTAAAKNIPAAGDASATEVVYGTDTRLTDARTPASHTHVEADITDLQSYIVSGSAAGGDLGGTYPNPTVDDDGHNHTLSTITDSGTAAAKNIPAAGDASATEVVYGTDTRLTDARTPASHTHTASDVTDFSAASDARIAAASFGDLADTTFTSLTSGDVATWNGSVWVNQAAGAPGAHASSHISAGSDEVDGDKLDIDWNPSNSTPATTPTEVTSVDHLTAHLYGIDQAIGGKAASSHTHVEADITDLGSYSVTGHTHTLSDVTDSGTAAAKNIPAAGDASATEVVYGTDTRLTDARTPTAHASSHITGGSDEIDGDKLDVDWNPSNYTPSTTPTEATSVDNLTAHLYGIDQKLPLKVFVGAVSWTAGTGTQAVTGAGFTPKAIMAFGVGFNNSASVMTFGMGASDGTNGRGTSIRADSSDGNRYEGAELIAYNGTNGTTSDKATLSSFDSDGFTFNKTTNTYTPDMNFILFG